MVKIFIPIQGDSWLVEITAGYDFLGFYDKNVTIKDPIINGYGCVVIFLTVVNARLWSASRKSRCTTSSRLQQQLSAEAATLQLSLFTTERQSELRPAVAFSKTCLKHRSV